MGGGMQGMQGMQGIGGMQGPGFGMTGMTRPPQMYGHNAGLGRFGDQRGMQVPRIMAQPRAYTPQHSMNYRPDMGTASAESGLLKMRQPMMDNDPFRRMYGGGEGA